MDIRTACLGAILGLTPTVVLTSSNEAWNEFRVAVETECRLIADIPESAHVAIEVSPFGSERFGAALVTVQLSENQSAGVDRMICIYDKATHKAEMAAPF